MQVMRVKLLHPKQKNDTIIAHTGGDLKILSQGIYENVKNTITIKTTIMDKFVFDNTY